MPTLLERNWKKIITFANFGTPGERKLFTVPAYTYEFSTVYTTASKL